MKNILSVTTEVSIRSDTTNSQMMDEVSTTNVLQSSITSSTCESIRSFESTSNKKSFFSILVIRTNHRSNSRIKHWLVSMLRL